MACSDRERLQQDLDKARSLYMAAITAADNGSDVKDNADAARFLYDNALKQFSDHLRTHQCEA